MTNTTCLRKKQRGIALLIVIFALLLVTGIALAMMSSSTTETQVERNYRDSQRAYFAALAGIQEARVRLLTENTNVVAGGGGGILPNGLTNAGMPGDLNPTGVVYIINKKSNTETVQPWTYSATNNFYDDELCHESFPTLTATWADSNKLNSNVPCITIPSTSTWYQTKTSSDPNTGTSAALSYKWVRISMKERRSGYPYNVTNDTTYDNRPICFDGSREIPLPLTWTSCNQYGTYETVYRVASLAVVPNPSGGAGTRRMVVAEVAKVPPLVTNAAVDSQDHVTLNGQLNVNGFDSCTCNLNYSRNNGYDTTNCTTTTVAGVQTTTCPNRFPYSCDNSKYAIYASGSVDRATSSENLVAGTNPAVVQNQPWNYDINNLINTYKQGAVPVTGAPYNYTCTAPTYDTNGNLTSNGSCGTQSSQTFGIPPTFPPTYDSTTGALITTGQTPTPYSQATYVPGDLKLTSSAQGSGILIVDGDLDIHGGLQFYGLILVRGVIKFTGGGSDSTNIIGAVLAGQESYVDNTLGGSAVIDFNSCALKQNTIPQPPRLVSIREATY